MDRDAKRRHLSLLAAEDLERLEREVEFPRLGKSLATWAADIGFWLVYGGMVVLVVYIVWFAPR